MTIYQGQVGGLRGPGLTAADEAVLQGYVDSAEAAQTAAEAAQTAAEAAAAPLEAALDTLADWEAQTVTYTDGSYINNTGGLTVNAFYRYAYVAVPAGVRAARLSGSYNLSSAVWAVTYYNDTPSSSTDIGREIQGDASYHVLTDQTITIPDGTTWIGLTHQLSDVAFTLEFLLVQDEIAIRLADTEATVALHETRLDTIETSMSDWQETAPSWVTGYYINGAGNLTADASYQYAYYTLDGTEQGLRLSGIVNLANGLSAVTYYSGTPSGATKLGSEQTSSGVQFSLAGEELTIPEGTAVVGLCNRIAFGEYTLEKLAVVTDLMSLLPGAFNSGRPILIAGDSTGVNIADDITSAYPDRDVYAQSISGQGWATRIRHRLGIGAMTITISGNTLLAAGTPVSCTLANASSLGGSYSTTPWYSGTDDTCVQVMVRGVRCALRTNHSGGAMTIEVLDDLDADVAVSAASPVTVLTGFVTGTGADAETCVPLSTMLSGTVLLRTLLSINDRSGVDYSSFDTFAAYVDEAMEFLSRYTTRIVAFGLMTGENLLPTSMGGLEANAQTSYNVLNYVRWMNAYLRNRTPAFLDVMANHAAHGDISPMTVNGVDFDILINTADGLHESSSQQARTTVLLSDTLTALGW